MKTSILARVLVVLLVLFGLLAKGSHAQSTNAAVGGQIMDEQGRVVPGVTVVLTNLNTGVRYETKTNGDGIYSAPALPPGIYRANVTKDGFKSIVKGEIELHVQDNVSINFALQIGSVTETVTVEAGRSMINTTDASVSTVVDQTYIRNMPLNGRSFQDLILLTPGIVTQTPQNQGSGGVGQTGEFSVNGQRTEANNYTVDGVSANVGATADKNGLLLAGPSGSVAAATALGTTQALVSVDDLQEFRVQSSTYSAEYGRNPGGQFAFETKSGTNQWHGTAYDYLRNGYFDAQDWFNDYFGVKGTAIRQNDFGGTFGGPVRIPGAYNGKDKTFFFVSYEGLRLTSPQPAAAFFVPDLALRASAPAPLQQALNAFPAPSPNGIDDATNGIAQYIAGASNPSSINSTSVRFDHVVRDRLRLFFRFSDTGSHSATRGVAVGAVNIPPSVNQISTYTMRTYTAGASNIFTTSLSNDLRFNYSSNLATNISVIDTFGGSTPVNLVQLSGQAAGSWAAVFLAYNGYRIRLPQAQSSGAQRQWNLVDRVSLALGRHHLTFGVDYRRLTPYAVPVNPSTTYNFLSKSAVQNNNATLTLHANAPAYPLYTNFSAFAQDEWRVSQRLSVSLGLRWEVNPPPGVTQGLKPYTFQGSGPDDWSLAPQGTSLWQTTWYNFAPRLGFAYVLHDQPDWQTVVRGGGGVFFDTGQQVGSVGFTGPGFFADAVQPNLSFPVNATTLIPTIANPPSLANVGFAYGFAPHLQLPYTLQWNASIEQALGNSQAFTVSYVSAHAARLLQESDNFSFNNPSGAEFFFIENGLTSDYGSLQLQFRRRLARGLTALASYTWSHCLDYGSLNYRFGYQRGNCDFDVRHNLSAAFSYDLPAVGTNSLAKSVLHHWGLDDRFTARTAFPVTLNGIENFDLVTGKGSSSGLDLVSGQPIYLYGANCTSILQALGDLPPGKGCPGGRAVNPNAFALPPIDPNTGFTTRPGNAPRNFVRGFGALQMDLAVRREFPIRERLKLQFRAEAFNIFNHPNFGVINSNFFQPTFGQATGTLANSLGIQSPLYQMGGSRSMQFALKFMF